MTTPGHKYIVHVHVLVNIVRIHVKYTFSSTIHIFLCQWGIQRWVEIIFTIDFDHLWYC